MSNKTLQILYLGLKSIKVDQGLQVRRALDEITLEKYQTIIQNKGELDPITVFEMDEDELGRTYLLAAGFHRYEAHRRENTQVIRAYVRAGNYEDAVAFAEDDNLKNGLPLNNEDKKNMLARRIERGHEWASWSDGRIAGVLGVDRSTISRWRAAIGATGAFAPVRIGADGREINVANISEANAARPKFNVGDWVRLSDGGVGQVIHASAVYGYTLRIDGRDYSWIAADFDEMEPVKATMPRLSSGPIKAGDVLLHSDHAPTEFTPKPKPEKASGSWNEKIVPSDDWIPADQYGHAGPGGAVKRIAIKIKHGIKMGYITQQEADNMRIEEVSSDLKDTRLYVWNRHGVREMRGGPLARPADEIAAQREAERLAAHKVEADEKAEEIRLAYKLRMDVERQAVAVQEAAKAFLVMRSVRSSEMWTPAERQGTIALLQGVQAQIGEINSRLDDLISQIEKAGKIEAA